MYINKESYNKLIKAAVYASFNEFINELNIKPEWNLNLIWVYHSIWNHLPRNPQILIKGNLLIPGLSRSPTELYTFKSETVNIIARLPISIDDHQYCFTFPPPDKLQITCSRLYINKWLKEYEFRQSKK